MVRNGVVMSAVSWIMIFLCWLAYGQFAYQANTFNKEEWYTADQLANSTFRAGLNSTEL